MGGEIGVRSELGAEAPPSGSRCRCPLCRRSSATAEGRSTRRAPVLIVKAAGRARAELEEHLAACGLAVEAAAGAGEALALCGGRPLGPPHEIIFLEIEWTAEAAAGVLSAIRGDERFAHTPVIVVASFGQKGDAKRAEELGARGYLTRPLCPRLVGETVSGVLRAAADGSPRLVTRHTCAEAVPARRAFGGAAEPDRPRRPPPPGSSWSRTISSTRRSPRSTSGSSRARSRWPLTARRPFVPCKRKPSTSSSWIA